MIAIKVALESRLCGSGDFKSGDSQLDAILNLHYRLSYHELDYNSKSSFQVYQVMLDKSLGFKCKNTLERMILSNIKGIIYYRLNKIEQSLKCFDESKDSELVCYTEFLIMLKLENFYYKGLSSCFHGLSICQLVTELPKKSNALTWYYLNLIITQIEITQLEKNSPLYLLKLLSSVSEHDNQLLEFGEEILSKCTFPNATEANNIFLEQFHLVLHHYFLTSKKINTLKWTNFITKSMEKTFQSPIVTKTAMIFFIKENQLIEATLNFANLINYSKQFFKLNNDYSDIVSLIESYNILLRQKSLVDIDKIFNKKVIVIELQKLIEHFYHLFNIPLISKDKSLDWLSNSSRLKLPLSLSKILSESWAILYYYYENSLSKLLKYDLTYYLANFLSICSDDELKFKYAYILSEMRQIELSIKFLKNGILNENPRDYKSWHLLALCESIQEDKNGSFKIVCSVIQAMLENLKSLSVNEKWQLIHLKITQLCLTHEIFGIREALEMLPETFELFMNVFPENSRDNIGPEHNQTKEYLLQTVWLFSATLYLNNNDYVNSWDALSESEKVTNDFTNLNHNLGKAYLSFGKNDQLALENLETVLFYDALNVDAIVGFGRLLFSDNTKEQLNDIYPQDIGNNTDVFISEENRSSAIARLKLLLEQVIEKDIIGYHTPEIWWYLSKIYEIYGDSERLEFSLWECIKFQELDPIRDFKFCNF